MVAVTASSIAETRRAIATRNGYLIACPCKGHGKGRGDLNPSLLIRDGRGGLLVRCFAGCDAADIRQALGAGHRAPDLAAARVRVKPRTTTEAARGIWRKASPIAGTWAAAYLVARGLDPPFPSAARFLPACERYPYPTLVAAITDSQARVVAVEMTYLDPGRPRKAEIATQRRVFGPAFGASIHCGRAGATLGLAEGLETALSAQRLFRVPTWAAAAERLAAVEIPPVVQRLVYFGDPDPAGAAALAKLRQAHPKIEVIDRTSPLHGHDWNDLARSGFAVPQHLAVQGARSGPPAIP